jgi:hypothetical protein
MAIEDLLHFECGMQRGTAPTANGTTLERFEEALSRHDAMACEKCRRVEAIPGTDGGCRSCGRAMADHRHAGA